MYLSFYAEVDGAVAAIAVPVVQPCSLKNPSGQWGYIMNVSTLSTFRRMGLSSQLVRHSWIRQGEPAYQKLGFQVHEEPTYRKFIER